MDFFMNVPNDWSTCSDVGLLQSRKIETTQFSKEEELAAEDEKLHQILPRLFLGNQQAAGKPMERQPNWEEKK